MLIDKSKWHYESAEKSILNNRNGKFPNVIKAYYAAYLPNSTYEIMKLPVGMSTITTSSAASSSSTSSSSSSISFNKHDYSLLHDSNNDYLTTKKSRISESNISSSEKINLNHIYPTREVWESKKYFGKLKFI